MKVSAWDGTTFDCEQMGEAAAFAAVAAYTASNPPPVTTPPTPSEPEATRDSVLAEGYVDESGVKLKASIEAQARFTAMTAGYINKVSLGEVNDDTIVYFYDFNDVPTPVTYLQYRQLMSRYQNYCFYVESQF